MACVEDAYDLREREAEEFGKGLDSKKVWGEEENFCMAIE